jgi:hypothetical protein
MTNLSSRRVLQKKEAALLFYVGSAEVPPLKSAPGRKCVSLMRLIQLTAAAISNWAESYNQNPDKFADFVMRYDLTISDSRMVYFHLPTSLPTQGI